MTALVFGDRLQCVPVVHGRLAFAIEVRRRLLEDRFEAVAIELPPSLKHGVEEALELLPRVSVVSYSQQPRFLDPEAPMYYVPIQPADAIVEALRIAAGERIPVAYVDAEIEDFFQHGISLPDPHALHSLGLEAYYDVCEHALEMHPHSEKDAIRESHMAAKLTKLLSVFSGNILFVGGFAHWRGIRQHLEQGSGVEYPGTPVSVESICVSTAHPRSIVHLMGEMPFVAAHYEKHRSGFELDDFDPVVPLKDMLMVARDLLQHTDPASLERPDPQRLRTTLDFLRKLVVPRGLLMPDSYSLTVAAKGVVGNDFALMLLTVANLYWYNRFDDEVEIEDLADLLCSDDGINPFESAFGDGEACPGGPDKEEDDNQQETEAPKSFFECNGERGRLDGDEFVLVSRLPGTAFSSGRLNLERRPDYRQRHDYEELWDERMQCSWPPEDLVIENFRDYVGKRALSLARVGLTKTEAFTTSFLDGLDLRETLRDVVDRKIHVREEPQVPGAVGALVMIFEEDDFGEKYPWRTTWMAEHQNESTLCFYATDFSKNLMGPGIARAFYGGCLLLFPPIPIPDVWNDLRFEQARTPSERLLLAGIYWSQDHFLVHIAARAPRPEVVAEASKHGKHILHLPLSTFSATTLERIRRVHVLNGHQVRSWAHRFIR